MSAKRSGMLKYRCRNCGALLSAEHSQDVYHDMRAACEDLYDTHACSYREIGIIDLIGATIDDE